MNTASPLPFELGKDRMKKTVLIYRSEILAFSETFIKAQTESLRKFRGQLIGLRPTTRSLPLSTPPILLTSGHSALARLKRGLFKHTGFDPSFYRRAKAVNPSLIHAHFAPDGAMALQIAEKLRLPLIVTLHGYDITMDDESHAMSTDGTIYLRRREQLWERASTFICISEYIRRKALEAGFPKEKLKVHYIGIDLASFAPKAEPREEGLVLFVGRLVEKKGCSYLLRAMKRVQKQCAKAKLLIIGDGPDRKELEALAKELDAPAEFLGPQPSDVIRNTLARAKVFCGPSIIARNGDGEGLGIVFCEAQAVGTPVVSFASGGIPEVVRHQETGLLAPEKDDKTLADYILQYLTDESFWHRSSEQGKSWVARQFDIHIQTPKLEEIYQEAIANFPR